MPGGFFLSLDGLDGAGKSTQCRLLADWLRGQGRAVVTCIDPAGTAVGRRLRGPPPGRGVMLPCEARLFTASRAQLVAGDLKPCLDADEIVLSDRFLLANIVYQGHAGGLDPEQLWSIGRFATGGVEPDLTVVLDMPLEAASARRNRPADRVEG